ncbi:hypothetical protein BJY52DRAFT_1219336 [Lactarius psammicola]|nr:hypothetical protein BJY52DRAFT_1219336 [Lactarius psammicola]
MSKKASRRAGVYAASRFVRGEVECREWDADISQKVYRHFVGETKALWTLTFQMERFYQMHVIPDVFPVSAVDLRGSFGGPPPKNAALVQEQREVHAGRGRRLCERADARPPKLYVTSGSSADVPDEENQSFKTYLSFVVAERPPLRHLMVCSLPCVYTLYPTAKLSLPPGTLERDDFDARKFSAGTRIRDRGNGGGAYGVVKRYA